MSFRFRVSKRLFEDAFLSSQTERRGGRYLADSWCRCERDVSLSLEITVPGEPPGREGLSGHGDFHVFGVTRESVHNGFENRDRVTGGTQVMSHR
jgi:hypothetical protein